MPLATILQSTPTYPEAKAPSPLATVPLPNALAELPALRNELNVIIVAIQNEEKGIFIYNPKGDTIVDEENKLIAIGEPLSLGKLKEL